MNILYLWQKPNWQDFPSPLLDATDTCVLIGDGVLATLLSAEKPTPPCSIFILAADLNTRQITLQPDTAIPIANEDARKRIWHRAIRAAHEPPLQRSEARFVGATRESPFLNSPVEYDISLSANRILKCNGYIIDDTQWLQLILKHSKVVSF